MLKGLMVGGFLANAASAGARADDAYAIAQIARNNADILESRLNQLREDLMGAIRNNNGFRLDDASLRAVLRDLLSAIREASPSHPFLDKANRDRMYGAAFEEAFLSAQNTGWATQIGNQKALGALIGAGAEALRQAAPGHQLLDADEQALVYWEAFESESVKINKLEGEASAGAGVWDVNSISQTNAIGLAGYRENRPYGWVPKQERGEWLEAQREKVKRKAGMGR